MSESSFFFTPPQLFRLMIIHDGWLCRCECLQFYCQRLMEISGWFMFCERLNVRGEKQACSEEAMRESFTHISWCDAIVASRFYDRAVKYFTVLRAGSVVMLACTCRSGQITISQKVSLKSCRQRRDFCRQQNRLRHPLRRRRRDQKIRFRCDDDRSRRWKNFQVLHRFGETQTFFRQQRRSLELFQCLMVFFIADEPQPGERSAASRCWCKKLSTQVLFYGFFRCHPCTMKFQTLKSFQLFFLYLFYREFSFVVKLRRGYDLWRD